MRGVFFDSALAVFGQCHTGGVPYHGGTIRMIRAFKSAKAAVGRRVLNRRSSDESYIVADVFPADIDRRVRAMVNRDGAATDRDELYGDWMRVGRDISTASRKFAQKHGLEEPGNLLGAKRKTRPGHGQPARATRSGRRAPDGAGRGQ